LTPESIPAAPKVTVICIFYNAAEFFAEAIDSVLAQDFDDFELLLVDDGSTDASTGIAKDYVRREPGRVRYLEHPGHVNRGMSATRNLGLQSARGEFVAFIDADDRWRPEKLREQAAVLASSGIDAVAGTVLYWRSWDGGDDMLVPTGHVQGRILHPPEASLQLYPLGSASAPCPSDLMLRRSSVEAVGGFEASFTGPLQMYEDQAFLSKFYLDRTIYFDDRTWLDYRLHDRSCMAGVKAAGAYHDVRSHFLTWFRSYLEARNLPKDALVRAAVKRQLRRMRLARLTAPLRKVARLMIG